jgi:N-acyl-D-aspartate/D-glutamate deacylase
MGSAEYRARAAAAPDLAALAAMLRDDGVRSSVLAELGPTLRGFDFDRMYLLGAEPDYEPAVADSIGAAAQRAGTDAMAMLYDELLRDNGRALVYVPILNYADNNLDHVREMLLHPHCVPGLSDGGAHVGTICDASFPTTLLQHWGRDRASGTLPVELLVAQQCRRTAEAVGLFDRGVLAAGYRADINVIDFDDLAVEAPTMAFDLPAGGKRLLQRARGYRHTLVAGIETYSDGVATGALPGQLVRGAQARP